MLLLCKSYTVRLKTTVVKIQDYSISKNFVVIFSTTLFYCTVIIFKVFIFNSAIQTCVKGEPMR